MVFIALEIELRMELILPRSTLAKFTCRGEGLTTGAGTGVVVMVWCLQEVFDWLMTQTPSLLELLKSGMV